MISIDISVELATYTVGLRVTYRAGADALPTPVNVEYTTPLHPPADPASFLSTCSESVHDTLTHKYAERMAVMHPAG